MSILKKKIKISIASHILLSSLIAMSDIEAQTSNDIPVLSMWYAPMPNPDLPAMGFEQLSDVNISHVFTPKSQDEAYNHCPELIWYGGLYHLMWINHPEGEDLPGQRILYSSSLDAQTWSPVIELFAPPSLVKVRKNKDEKLEGTRTKSYFWYVVKNRLFAIAGCYDNSKKNQSIIAREVLIKKMEFGPIFNLNGILTVPTVWPVLKSDDKNIKDVAILLWEKYQKPENWPTQAPIGWQQQSLDGTKLWEPTIYRTTDGKYVGLWRAKNFCHRMYCSISTDGISFPPARPTNIPDSPSLSRAVSLSNGKVLLIGNQVASEFDNGALIEHYQRDPLTVAVSSNGYQFERVFSLRTGAPTLKFKSTGGIGFQYPSAIIHDGKLIVAHSVGKENIDVAVVSLSNLGINTKK